MDQVGLTAYTLVIIDLRAAALGDMAEACPTGHRRVHRPMGPMRPRGSNSADPNIFLPFTAAAVIGYTICQ